MSYWLTIVLMTAMMSVQSVFVKRYERTVGSALDVTGVFSVVRSLLMVAFFWGINGFGFAWRGATALWGTAHGIALGVTMFTTAMAYMTGPFALSSLIISSSMVLVTLVGIFFLHEPVTLLKVLGILMVFAALVLLNTGTAPGKKEQKPLTGRWWMYVGVAFFFNAGCNLTQKFHQIGYPAGYENDFMIIGSAVSALVCVVICLVARVTPASTGRALRRGWVDMLGAAGSCALANVMLMYLNVRVPASLLFPTVSGLTLVISALLGKFIYREKFTRRQTVSYLLGLCAIVLMNM